MGAIETFWQLTIMLQRSKKVMFDDKVSSKSVNEATLTNSFTLMQGLAMIMWY